MEFLTYAHRFLRAASVRSVSSGLATGAPGKTLEIARLFCPTGVVRFPGRKRSLYVSGPGLVCLSPPRISAEQGPADGVACGCQVAPFCFTVGSLLNSARAVSRRQPCPIPANAVRRDQGLHPWLRHTPRSTPRSVCHPTCCSFRFQKTRCLIS